MPTREDILHLKLNADEKTLVDKLLGEYIPDMIRVNPNHLVDWLQDNPDVQRVVGRIDAERAHFLFVVTAEIVVIEEHVIFL